MKRPSDGFWIVSCKKDKKGRCNAVIENIYTEAVEISCLYPPHTIAKLNTSNINWTVDARIIAAAPDLYWACNEMLKIIDAQNKGEEVSVYHRNYAETLLRKAVSKAQQGYSHNQIESFERKRRNNLEWFGKEGFKLCDFEKCQDWCKRVNPLEIAYHNETMIEREYFIQKYTSQNTKA